MNRWLALFLLVLSLPARAQTGKTIALENVVYVDDNPDKYSWKKVLTLKDRILYGNSVVIADSFVFSFGGFNKVHAQREMNVLTNSRFTLVDLQYPGPGFIYNIFFLQDSLLFVGGGADSGMSVYCFNDFWQYNLHSQTWKRLKDLPFYYRSRPTLFQDNGQVMALIPQLSGERFEVSTATFYSYNIATDEWSRITNVNPAPNLAQPAAFKIGDEAFVFFESKQSVFETSNAFYKFNFTTHLWSALSPFPGPARGFVFAGSNHRYGYIGGGMLAHSSINARDVYRYDPGSERWERCKDLPHGVRRAVGWSYNHELYVGFGINDQDNTMTIWKLRQKR